MSKPVLLLTDRPAFEQAWRPALERSGLDAQVTPPESLTDVLRDEASILIDGGCELFDEDELLAHVGLARALRVNCAVVLPDGERHHGVEELLDDLCPGLVTRGSREAERIAAALGRRADHARTRRFDYLAVSPRPKELLAILADGTAALLPRPVSEADDGSEVTSIALGEGAESASIALSSGRELTLHASGVTQHGGNNNNHRPSVPPPMNGSASAIPIDGVRLGARLRELRVQAGLTQAELARRTGIHRPNIARVEAGRHTPSLETLARLASAIGVPTTTVLAEE
jgi:DNA-binding XRE family transcriptional regulator